MRARRPTRFALTLPSPGVRRARGKMMILASASPRRRHLLRKAGWSFRVIPSEISEKTTHRKPIPLVKDLARRKAFAVASWLRRQDPGTFLTSDKSRVAARVVRCQERPHVVVLGADTVVVLRGKILGKPASRQAAIEMLRQLSGTTHTVYTGVAWVDACTRRSVSSYAASIVRMKKMTPQELRRYSRKHLDKAGSYAIQERGDPIARVVKGSYDNVVGLPVGLVARLLKRMVRAHSGAPLHFSRKNSS
jgi:septum formation protein